MAARACAARARHPRTAGRAAWAAAALLLATGLWLSRPPAAPGPNAFAGGSASRLGRAARPPPTACDAYVRMKSPIEYAKTLTGPLEGEAADLNVSTVREAFQEAGVTTAGTVVEVLQRYLTAFTASELKDMCRSSGCRMGGTKHDLASRLAHEARFKVEKKRGTAWAALGGPVDVTETILAQVKPAFKAAGLPAPDTRVFWQLYLDKLNSEQLRECCRRSGLMVGGTKAELVARLVEEAQSKAVKKEKAAKAKKTAMQRSIYAKVSVFRGKLEETSGGVRRDDIVRNKQGRYVFRRLSDAARKRFADPNFYARRWSSTVPKARRALSLTGFVPVGGKTKQGQALYNKIKSLL